MLLLLLGLDIVPRCRASHLATAQLRLRSLVIRIDTMSITELQTLLRCAISGGYSATTSLHPTTYTR
jgi:hypothetical protein